MMGWDHLIEDAFRKLACAGLLGLLLMVIAGTVGITWVVVGC